MVYFDRYDLLTGLNAAVTIRVINSFIQSDKKQFRVLRRQLCKEAPDSSPHTGKFSGAAKTILHKTKPPSQAKRALS
jgi:hypothetical protein